MVMQSVEARIQEAIQHLSDNPGAKVATVAKQFGVPRNRLRMPNKKLSEPEEQAICNYIDRLDRISLAVRAEFVTDAANYILKQRSSRSLQPEEIPVVNPQWTTRFLKRHGYCKQLRRKLNSDRQASENLERVNEYFFRLREVIQTNGIPPEDTWNMDETGFRIGIGRDQGSVSSHLISFYFARREHP
ncbi:tc5 transposase DNA-binding domain-containing protein [Pochonia chlamydosporia 170]|uniref:Tc5 transposase DNA-binding domain-containing protein n=1 Tax=Pochonia chlamydosporia 170 TaxID=1380566 RepID=A0A179EXB1_METCM|nr:tc5 transposase DNA-binding domain-containing protein [Pochonia chlamydosporia 170]OAQ57817.2 tc5 transposase DNA-binding domain-containing protein [Pochonia chlamydosporia 170]